MTLYIIIAIIILVTVILRYYALKHSLIRKEDERIKESLEDESIYVKGRGKLNFEEIQKITESVPKFKNKRTHKHMFAEGLMEFEGEFLIKDVPLNEERRLSIDDPFLYLQELFGTEIMLKKPMLTIDDPIFKTQLKDKFDLINLAHTISTIMDLDPAQIKIDFFTSNENYSAAGLYHGKMNDGRYKISLLENIYLDLEKSIATIAHELAHIKLLGEERIEENSEELTDIVPLLFGFGIFNANAVFKFTGNNSERSWSTSQLGYLSQADWGYLFALYRYVTVDKEPEWLNYLNKTTAKDSQLAYDFIVKNPDKVLQQL